MMQKKASQLQFEREGRTMEPNWSAVGDRADGEYAKKRAEWGTRASELKKNAGARAVQLDYLKKELDDLLSTWMLNDRIWRICRNKAPEAIAETIGELRDNPGDTTDAQDHGAFKDRWNAALDVALDQFGIRQAVEAALLKKAQKAPPATGS